MKAHLIKSSEVSQELFTKVVGLLKAVKGVIKISFQEEAFVDFHKSNILDNDPNVGYTNLHNGERQYLTWGEIFKECEAYRKNKGISKDEFVILLTHFPNEYNWFQALDPHNPFNGFVHTADWEMFVPCPPEFPIAYEALTSMLHKHIFYRNDSTALPHKSPIGCISDFCGNKKEVILKLRTADICPQCIEELKPRLSMPEIYHALEILESLRVKMLYAQNFKQLSPPSRLHITKNHKIILLDYQKVEIPLTPLLKSLYFLFLNYPDGIIMSELCDHKKKLTEIYYGLYNNDVSKDKDDEMKISIKDITNSLNKSATEKIAKIKSIFEKTIGESLATHYYIKGEVGQPKKITLDRSLVSWGA